ncbi:hypothetical protein ES695_12910 [Candidatus Atribacteria bacterium 1244-E10-H5-B2]|nr:MAG: hypothetical protein ES695_12910 [Candidatus Atribacteria bacterium 1244-E10-H5-B2]
MKNKGWTKFHREQFSHWVSEKKPWCDGYAWTYLYNMANHKPGKANFRNEYIPIDRGQFVTSKIKLETTFSWTRRRLDNFLKALENDEMITYRITNRYTVITIINYEIYQGDGKQNDIQNNRQIADRLQTDDKQVSINKNEKNGKYDKKKKENISFNFIKKEFINLTEEKMEEFDEKYTEVGIDLELARMENWLMEEKKKRDNGERNKIPKDYNRFIHNWLRRSDQE